MSDGISSSRYEPINTDQLLKLAFTGVVLVDTDCDIGTKLVWNTSKETGNIATDLGYLNNWFTSREEFLSEIESRLDHNWCIMING